MRDRDARNLRIALLAEWAAEKWLLEQAPGPLPSSALRARANGWRDGGWDVLTQKGRRVDVKASGPRYPELMIPIRHEGKFRQPTCPVDLFVKACVDTAPLAALTTITCWEEREVFLENAHRDELKQRYPIPTLWLMPEECHPVYTLVDVPVATMEAIDRFISDDVPDVPWEGWLTL